MYVSISNGKKKVLVYNILETEQEFFETKGLVTD